MPSVEGLRENRTEEATPYVAGVHVDWGVRAGEKRLQLASVEVEGQRASAGGRRFGVVGLRGERQEREEIAAGQALEAEGFELLRGALFSRRQGLVTGLKRAPRMGCMMPSVEGRH